MRRRFFIYSHMFTRRDCLKTVLELYLISFILALLSCGHAMVPGGTSWIHCYLFLCARVL